MHATITSAPPAGGPSDFTGFSPSFFGFLRELEQDNDSEWFASNRERFERDVRTPALAFVRAVAPALALSCPALIADDGKSRGSMLRMNRDTRFSASKLPYHTSVVLRFPHRGADLRTAPSATLRLTSRKVVIAAGVRPGGSHTLGLLRSAIDADRAGWAAIRSDHALCATFGDLAPPELVRVPSGWPPDHPFADDLRRKAFRVVTELPTEIVGGADFAKNAAALWSVASPLLRFVSTALGLAWGDEAPAVSSPPSRARRQNAR
jgi:uncharacterized protein (TIGR02453 family)